MSKSLNVIAPVLGGVGLTLGVAYGLTTNSYRDAEITSLQTQLDQTEARIEAVKTTAFQQTQDKEALVSQVAELQDIISNMPARGAMPVMAAPAKDDGYGLGRAALDEEIAAWDIDVRPDGTGLPVGSGDVLTGEEVFSDNCAVCHGEFAEGVGNWPKLAGGDGTLADKDPLKTVGSYWPYLSTTWDYVNRSMPFGNAQSLSADDVYAITAYILYSNDIVDDEEFVLSNENFLDVEMPNAAGFIIDDRAEAEYAHWRAEPCMQDCKDSVEITMRATVLDVTPEETEEANATEAAVEAPAQQPATSSTGLDPELVSAGEKVFKKCKSCHQIGAGAKNRTGPQLNAIVGASAGTVEGFKYSPALKSAAADGLVWNEANLAAFLSKPKDFMKGTKMSFAGLRSADDIAAVTAYLQSASE